MPPMNKNCLFHTDRLQFDLFEKEIKRLKWIPRYYSHRLASAVCSCRKHPDWEPDDKKLAHWIQYISRLIESNDQTFSPLLVGFLKRTLETATTSDYCRCRLLQILFLAHYGNFMLLTRSAIRRNSILTFSTDEPWRNNYSSKVQPTHQHDHLPQGNHREKIFDCEENETATETKKDNFIWFSNQYSHHKYFNNNINKAHIDIRRQNPGCVRSLRSWWKLRARYLRQRHHCELVNDTKTKKQRRGDMHNNGSRANLPETSTGDDIGFKDILADDFGLKVLRHDSRKKNEKKSVLDGGHCFNCLQPFTSLKNPETCKHHPGFVVYRYWSCCYAAADRTTSLANDHAKSGCVEGPHVWRTHKRANRKPNKERLNRNPVLNIHLKELK